MTERETLKPCAHCGGTEFWQVDDCPPDLFMNEDGEYAVVCICGASGPWEATPEDAYAAWNRRATPPAGPVWWIARDESGLNALACKRPLSKNKEYGYWYSPPGAERFPVLPGFADALGLAPGECQRFRLTVEGERDGK